jgi:hypothetical protein
MRSVSEKHARWFGVIVVNRRSRFMTYGNVLNTVFVGVFVRRLLFLVLKAELHIFSGAGTLAFAIRSGVNLILLLARVQGFRKVPRCVQGCP